MSYFKQMSREGEEQYLREHGFSDKEIVLLVDSDEEDFNRRMAREESK